MPWEIHITGPPDILQELAQAFRDDPSVAAQGEGWILRSRTFDGLSDATAVRERGEEIARIPTGSFPAPHDWIPPTLARLLADVKKHGTD